MEFSFPDNAEGLLQEVRDFLNRELNDGVIKETDAGVEIGKYSWELMHKLGAKRWLAPGFPREYGGLGVGHFERFVIADELTYQRAQPLTGGPVGVRVVGPTLLAFGNDEQKRDYLPRIARGEIDFALGYTEPEAGSDLVSLEIKAVKDGNQYVINGQKLYNTGCHFAQYHWLAVRTNPNVPKHKGVSLFIVDMKTPGITVKPLWVMDGERTNEVFYDDVRVPKENLVGEENRGFFYMRTALALERSFHVGGIRRIFDDFVEFIKSRPEGKDPLVRQSLAQFATELHILHLLAYQVAWLSETGVIPEWQAPALKVSATEFLKRFANEARRILGLYGLLERECEWAPLMGRISYLCKLSARRTVAGGASEILRNTIALRGLDLPRE